jgi:lysyl-tRNA synthetase class 2
VSSPRDPAGDGGATADAPTQADAPADVTTDRPTDAPTEAPADAPTDRPADRLTDAPTDRPTEVPAGVTAEAPADDAPEQMRIRRAKRDRMLAEGREPYPVGVPVTTTIEQVRQEHAGLAAGEETEHVVGVAGRVVFVRNTGKLCFATVQDGAGRRLQVMLSQAVVGAESLDRFKSDVDLGDHLFAGGRVICSRRGELSVFADDWRIAAKALRPLPVLHRELSEEARVRQRSVDLIVRPAAREMVRLRAAVVRSLRENLHVRGYLEVETPMLQTQHGGAAARPFVTHMNAFGLDLFLRIAPELFLKRAAVGGIERVFEINRNFRNEGADSSHSPEFAMLEAYEAYGDYDTMAALTMDLVQTAARDALGGTLVTLADGTEYDLGGQWSSLGLYDSLSEAIGEEITPATSVDHLMALVERFDVQVDPARQNHGKLVEELWEHHVAHTLHAPTFVRDFPVETSPLTRDHRAVPGVVEKWDLYVRGFELATAYSELVDPVIQRLRFEEQALMAAAGDEEAMRVDEEFLAAMEHAMPPSGGMGMGIDRLLMALTGQGIRETILFPLVRPAH